jgi:mannuronan 5-epimerase
MKRIVISGLIACGLLLSSVAKAELYDVQSSEQKIIEKPLPVLPDISGYSRDAILQKISKWHKPAQVNLSRMINSVATRKFFKGGNLGVWAEKQAQFPKAVFLDNGIITLPELNKKLPTELIKISKHQYLLRVPIVVKFGAALYISPGEELLLSIDRGSFLVNAGEVFMVDGALRSWNEKTKSPAKYSGNKDTFRPFYVAWSGSETYVYGSLIESLGSQSSKAYGFSLSTYTEQDQMYAPNELNRQTRPKGWLVNNHITDLYYGFYSYEADDVVLIGNKYIDNIYYGIDPHDRSHRIIIANNEVSGLSIPS